MLIDKKVNSYILNPFPLWENELTEYIVSFAWRKLKANGISSPEEYTTARILNKSTIPKSKKIKIIKGEKGMPIYLEAPSGNFLDVFYLEHDLVIEKEENISNQLIKLQDAIKVLAMVKPVINCIELLVRTIQIIRQEHAEIDLSYSNPKVPFSIFVSVCEDNSTISNLRVAESILHEAMHLKLTLIENITPLLLQDTGNRYFSPWRDEKRPARGVLHGLFVFRAILDFYSTIKPLYLENNEVTSYLDFRLKEISSEISSLIDFPANPDLTQNGATLTKNLLPLN